jgi:DNA-binding NarL/FixJ family response regulator
MTTAASPTTRKGHLRFALHYLEMVVSMLVGMFALDPLWPAGLTGHDAVGTLVMATNMSIGMAVWMTVRRHPWRRTAEMVAAMYAPFVVLLGVHPDIEVVGEAGDGAEAVDRVAACAPDVVLMDLRMPVLDGVAATRHLRIDHPGVRVIALTTFDDDEDVFAALRAGAVGYLLKDVSSARLVEAVLAAARGESVLQPSVAAKVVARVAALPAESPAPAAQPLVVPLSERELDVVRLLAQGRSNREIAAALYLAEGTVKNHVTSVLGKLGARDRTQAALRARELGIG